MRTYLPRTFGLGDTVPPGAARHQLFQGSRQLSQEQRREWVSLTSGHVTLYSGSCICGSIFTTLGHMPCSWLNAARESTAVCSGSSLPPSMDAAPRFPGQQLFSLARASLCSQPVSEMCTQHFLKPVWYIKRLCSLLKAAICYKVLTHLF